MRYQIFLLAIVSVFLLLSAEKCFAQDETPKAEVGAQFTLLNVERISGRKTEPGFGGRFTYNATRNIGLEAEVNFLPRKGNGSTNIEGGRITQGLFGIKAGKRFERVGVFGKVRPGFVSYDRVIQNRSANDPVFRFGRQTYFATDVGGVIEFYPSRRALLRFDVGDTIIRYGGQNYTLINGSNLRTDAFVRHNLQVSAGVGFRF
jgi:hypothetical protein